MEHFSYLRWKMNHSSITSTSTKPEVNDFYVGKKTTSRFQDAVLFITFSNSDNDEIDLGITDVALKCADLTASLLERTDTECDR